jgi:flavin reductase (DIM6/NTAB) family NADH-FMN oxidoreductase RutF
MVDVFEEINMKSMHDNVFHLLDDEWMLITAGDKESFNTMTASWGSFGFLWQKPIATIFIRPQRYTLEFIEKNDVFTLSFFAENYKQMLNYCGQHSGKNVNKVKEMNLTTKVLPSGNISFDQARMVIECKKLYSDNLKEENFISRDIIHRVYPTKDFHRMFIGEITHCYIQKNKHDFY